MSFESYSGEAVDNFGETLTPEERASRKAAREQAETEKEQFLAGRRRELAAEKADADKKSQTLAEESLERHAVEVCLSANPNFSETEARRFYNHHFRQLIAIERFRTAFFGNSDAAKKMFDDLHM